MKSKQYCPDECYANRITGIYERGLTPLTKNLDPERHLVYQNREQKTYRPAASLPLAEALLKIGSGDTIEQAVAILNAVLPSQVTDKDHPHVGNWLWLADDNDIEDLNAVFFVMRSLIPLLVRYDHLIPPDVIEKCQVAVRLSLYEIERMDLAASYSNVYLVSLFALLIGGSWIEDPHYSELGKKRWDQWVKYTLKSGAPHEYNSPVYGAAELYALTLIQQFTDDTGLRLQVRIFYERVLWHLILHMHTPTGQLAGPHSRCYWWPMLSGQNGVKNILWRETGWQWLLEPGSYGGHPASVLPGDVDLANLDYWLPPYLVTWLTYQRKAMPYEVRETANAEEGSDLITYFSNGYALGTASNTYSVGTECFFVEHEANYLMLHYAKTQSKWGMMYSRYIVNDRHWGKLGAAPDRPKTSNFYDQGHFAGVQCHNKAIGLYALKVQHEQVNSLKTVVAIHSGEDVEGISINNTAVQFSELPVKVSTDDWVVITDGEVHIAIKALEPSRLGLDAPILLERGPHGELWFTIYNYRGSLKRFWDYASLKGAFWRGNIRAGFVVEVLERSEFPSLDDVFSHLITATISDTVDDQVIRTVTYSSGGESLTIKYDLWHTQPHSRYLDGVRYNPPQLSSPIAVQGDTGSLKVGHAQLDTNPQSMFLAAQELDPDQRSWILINPENIPTPVRLQTPNGVVSIDALGLGRLLWYAPINDEQEIIIESLEPPVGLTIPDGIKVSHKDI